ncbi:MAG: hypothetical protein K5695_09960 [Oscillospiraceae bacterium]|nr:hypothetical protein [Oscillospiraceae bacterium]
MKQIKLSGLLAFLCFVIFAVWVPADPSIFVKLSSKVIWTIDKNAYSGIGIFFYDNDYIVTPAPETSTDYEFEQMMTLKEKLDADGIELLYVCKPTKYLDDSIFDQFGEKNYCNRNADKLLSRLDAAGVHTLDLRQEIRNDGLDIYQMFYRTDHHWTVPAGKWGTSKIARALNEDCGYGIDLSIYDDENYIFKTTPEAWYGEQGEKLNGSDLKKDDYTLVTPDFDTCYTIGGEQTDFVNGFIYNPDTCYHYNYHAEACINENVPEGNILFLGDSYDMVTEPFLSLSVHQIDFLLMRNLPDMDIYERFIREGGYDTVVICYAPFMIGAHDDEESANYKMFAFMPDGSAT